MLLQVCQVVGLSQVRPLLHVSTPSVQISRRLFVGPEAGGGETGWEAGREPLPRRFLCFLCFLAYVAWGPKRLRPARPKVAATMCSAPPRFSFLPKDAIKRSKR